jgi:NADH dehydrogenase
MHESSSETPADAREPTVDEPRSPRTLVAGGTGFLGSAIVRALVRAGQTVSVLSRRARSGNADPEAIDHRVGDVTRPASLGAALEGVDQVIQCVQFPGFPVEDVSAGRTFLDVDAKGTMALVRAATEAGARKFVYLSGVGADRASTRSWYRAKGLAEQAVAESGLAYAIVRPSWVYGPGDVSLNRFVRLIRSVPGPFPQLGEGDQKINPVYISDVARLVADIAGGSTGDGATIEIGGPAVLTMDGILRIVMRVVERQKPIIHVPVGFARLGALLLELVPGQVLSRDAVDFVLQSAVADNTELMRRFPGFELREMEDALASYLTKSGPG